MITMYLLRHPEKAKFRIRPLLAACFIGGLLCGCDSETPTPDEATGQPVLLNISNRALATGTGDTQVNSLRVILVRRDNIDRTVVSNDFVPDPATNPVVVKARTGNYDVYVVANEAEGNGEYAALGTVRNLADLQKTALPFDPAKRTMTNIPMFGQTDNVTIGLPAGAGASSPTNLATVSGPAISDPTKLPVTLIRMACKVKLTLRRSTGTLKAIAFRNLPDVIPLFASYNDYTPAARPEKTVAPADFTEIPGSTDPLYPLVTEKEDILLPSWLFTPADDADKAVRLEVTVTGTDGKTDRTYSTPVGHDIRTEATPKDYTLWRNYDYTLGAVITNYIMTVQASVVSWNDEELSIDDDNPDTQVIL